MESLKFNNEEKIDNNNESITSPDNLSYEVDPQIKAFIEEYKKEVKQTIDNIQNNNSISDPEKKGQLDSLKLKLVDKINALEKERDEIWKEVDDNEGYPISEVVLGNDLANQLTVNINELSKLLNSYDPNIETGFK